MKKLSYLFAILAVCWGGVNSVAVAATCTSASGGGGNTYTIGAQCNPGADPSLLSGPCSGSTCIINLCHDRCICAASCLCMDDYYSARDGSSYICKACPSGGRSMSGMAVAITDCYKVTSIYDAAIHGSKSQTCYSNASGSYTTNCQITGMYACDAGYYRANTTDMFCTAVGGNYYSPAGSLSRTLCQPYTNPSGGTSYGQTAGGAEADAINDCRIPMSEVFSDTTGKWVYDPYCKYQ